MKQPTKKQLAGVVLCCFIACMGFMAYTDPARLPAVLLPLPLLFLFIIISSSVLLLSRFGGHNRPGVNSKKQVVYSLVIASVPVMMLLLRSVDQLTFKDILLIVILAFVGVFYLQHFRLGRNVDN